MSEQPGSMMGDSYIVAIDFGTAYSGYAFNMTSRGEETEPNLQIWGKEVGLETPKTPTCILFDEHEQFVSFGYEAKETYVSKKGSDARGMLFFDCFKMELYSKKLSKDLTIKAANGKSVKALKVFTEALRFLKDDALKTINSNTKRTKFIAADFTWVLTVPAIWDPSAKQFMREAATQAEIVTESTKDKLLIALEPEAASVYCKKLSSEGFIARNQGERKLDQSPGTQYIVVDCGGGTIDITVHEVLKGGFLKELHKASGNDLGGQTVDRKFKEFLKEIFGDVWEEYEKNYPSEVQRMMYDFTVFKKKDKYVEITCTLNLGTLAQKKQDMEMFFKKVSGASWNDGSIRISKDTLRSFFDGSLKGITRSLREIFRKDFNIEFVLLVGGFAESEILRQQVMDQFGGQCEVLCPFRPQEAVLRGAVEFGRNPAVVTSRKSHFTYGVCVWERFDQEKHRADKKLSVKEGDFCQDIFKTLVEMNESVGWNETKSHILFPIEADQTYMDFRFYRAEKKNIKYVDEDKAEEIGCFTVPSLDITNGVERQIELKINFGFTEMTATATDIDSGSTKSLKLDFMTKSSFRDVTSQNLSK